MEGIIEIFLMSELAIKGQQSKERISACTIHDTVQAVLAIKTNHLIK